MLALAALALAAAAAVATPALGTFAAQTGFSGRNADCSACHNRPMPAAPPAVVTLSGLPDAYEGGATYLLPVAVAGGPDPNPVPGTPQGGFELEASAGTLAPAAGFEDLLRTPGPRILTYEPAGTLHRDWEAEWTAPGLEAEPQPVTLWLAAVAANGDHVVALNTSDLGERFDSVATMSVTVPPDPALVAAWRALPLVPPVLDGIDAGTTLVADGSLPDRNATHLRHRVDTGPWSTLAVEGRWRIRYEGLAPGEHALELVAEGRNRTSAPVLHAFAVADANGVVPGRDAPASLLPVLPALAGLALWSRRR